MRYGHKCETHGEFDDVRPMDEAGNPAPCPQCGIPCARYYGYGMPLIVIPGYFHTNHASVIPKRSDFEYHADYLKATENLAPFKGADKHELGQDPEQAKIAADYTAETAPYLNDPAVQAAIEKDRAETLAA